MKDMSQRRDITHDNTAIISNHDSLSLSSNTGVDNHDITSKSCDTKPSHFSHIGDNIYNKNIVMVNKDIPILSRSSSSNISEKNSDICDNRSDMKPSHMFHSRDDITHVNNAVMIDTDTPVLSCSSSSNFSYNNVNNNTDNSTNDNNDNNYEENYEINSESNNGYNYTLLPVNDKHKTKQLKVIFSSRNSAILLICVAIILFIIGIDYRKSNSSIYDSIYRYVYILTYMDMNVCLYKYRYMNVY
jgi:hypothetical protein